MIEENIFKKISQKAPFLDEDDLDTWVVPMLMEHYDPRLHVLARKAYKDGKGETPTIAVDAFKEHSKIELRSALETFFFRKEHWKNNRDLNSYLLTCFRRLSGRLYWDQNIARRTSIPTCPACKYEGRKELLLKESGMLKCQHCTKESERLADELKNMDQTSGEFILIQTKYKFYSQFAFHSKKGLKCPDCSLFIPESIVNDRVLCPYPNCIYMGGVANVDQMSHPTGVSCRNMVSLNKPITTHGGGSSTISFQDMFEADTMDPAACLDMQARCKKEHDVLSEVIEDQIRTIKRTNSSSTMIQKLLMYEAYKKMLNKHPEDMISYLAHVKQNSDFPIQARIFQEYTSLIENALPFSIEKRGKTIDIISLTNPDLALFEGISTFKAEIGQNYTIPNNTTEEYIGGRNFKNYGRCFIGRIIDIIDDTGKSIKNNIKEYSFVQIKMDELVKSGTPVTVKHFRILPHYEMHSMVFLQRIRRHIVDSIYFRLHKTKRIPRRKKCSNEE